VRLPPEGKSHFEFRFNERTFDRQQVYRKGEAVDLGSILEQFKRHIEDAFADLDLDVQIDKSAKAITVEFGKIEKTLENARRLVDVVEFVKTLVITLA